MYIVPQRTPAPSAAQTPRKECPAGPCVEEAMARSVAPAHITSAPPSTPVQRRQPAWRSSLKKRKPQKMPSRLLEFQSGKAMLSPISRMARMVSVLATAQRQPARTAQIIKCGARRTSARTDEVPSISRKTPEREENADDHDEGNRHRGNADGNKFGGCLGGTQPCARREAGKDAEELKCFGTRSPLPFGRAGRLRRRCHPYLIRFL